jgi:hexosaminidase
MFRTLFILSAFHIAACADPALMPLPAKAAPLDGKLAIDSVFRITIAGHTDPRLEAGVRRFIARVGRETGIPFTPEKATAATLTVEIRDSGPADATLGEDESYRLDVSSSGAHLVAATTTGALRGLATFAQLIVPGPSGYQVAAIAIDDHPRFPWRGLMIDASRHWMPVQMIERNLDAMASVKLNVLHWHLSDDQGFRVESKRFPRLQELGSEGNFYTQQDVRHIVDYARARGIRVVPEFDIPGHATSWFTGYPELASAKGPYQIERKWGIFEPTIDPTREETYRFLEDLLAEMAALFPDPYFHIGGDEVKDTHWKQSPAIQDFEKTHGINGSHELQAYFNRRVQEILKKQGKTMIGWDEVLSPGLAPDTVIQSWRGQQSLAEAAAKGYRGLLSFGYYLDHIRPASYHYGIDPLDGAAKDLDEKLTARILGGEACMWVEYVDEETVDSRIWPRMAAIAERFWSPREVKDVESMYARLEPISRKLEWEGVKHRANYAPMLDRLAGGQPSGPVRVLADAVEPTEIQRRRDTHRYTSLVPLNRLVDTAHPESELPRHPDHAELRVLFSMWSQNHALFLKLAHDNFLLEEAIPLSKNLAALGDIGLKALDYLQSGKPVPENWIKEQIAAVDGMKQPTAEVRLAAVRPVRELLDSLASQR